MKQISLLVLIILLISSITMAQRGNRKNSGNARPGIKITGKVIDATSKLPIEYSNLVLLREADSVQVTGTITDREGTFLLEKLRPNKYIVKASFIGYEPVFVNDISVERGTNVLDIGTIELKPTFYETESAVVLGTKSPVEYHIDKKVINVSGQNTSISGSAVDVLENVPSVNVDIEGNVSLRGSGSFTLLIDGRPTILDANDALQQIPASTIENIEIVTNPSAKYDPEGVSGIINIIMKKSEYVGISGILNAHVGLDDKYGADVITSYKTNGYTFYLGADYREGKYPGTSENRRVTFTEDYDYFLNSESENSRGRDGYNFTGGADLVFDKKNALGISLRYGDRTHESNSTLNFHQFSQPATTESKYKNENVRERGGDSFSSSLNFKHVLGENKHEITTDLTYQRRSGKEFTINEYYGEDGLLASGQKSTEDGPSERFRAKIDYSLPLSVESRFDAGYQSEMGKSVDDSKSFDLDADNNQYLFQDEFSNIVDYSRNIHSIYSIFNSKLNNFGYQVGLRGEYTDRLVTLTETNEDSKIQRWDYFPTIHTSYSFDKLVQLMASYTRRIRRPRGHYLEPFLTWEDQNSVRRGNPDLEPEYINSFEIAYLTHVDDVILSLETYYRERKNKIERITSIYDTNVNLSSVENVGTDHTLGTEFMVNSDIGKIWNINFMGDLSQYKVEGTYNGRDFSRDNFNWSLRLNNTFMITPSTKFQVNGRYRGPSVSAQGEYKGSFSSDVALRQDLWEKKLALTLQIRDIFQTSKREGYTYGQGFETYRSSVRKAPVIMLNLTLNLNNFKQKRDKNRDGGDDEGEDF